MTITNTSSRNNYTGNNTTGTYAYQFKIFADSDLVVTVRSAAGVETTLALTTNYTVTGRGVSTGGNVVLTTTGAPAWMTGSNLATGYTLSIRRVRPLTQDLDIKNQGEFYPSQHEEAFDKARMIDQQQQDEISRAVRLSETMDPATFDPRIPAALGTVANAGRTIVTNPTGTGFEIGPNAADIAAAQSNAATATAQAAIAVAAAASAQNLFRDVVISTGGYTVTSADRGKVINMENTGPVSVSLPQISTLTLTSAFPVVIRKSSAGTDVVTINCGGTDTIGDGSDTSLTLRTQGQGVLLVPDTDFLPDKWVVLALNPRTVGYDQINDISTDFATLPGGVPLSDFLPITSQSAFESRRVQAADLRRRGQATKTATFTATQYEEDIFVSASGGAVTANLYAVAGRQGKWHRIQKTDTSANVVTIDPNGAEQIGGASTLVLARPGESVVIACNGTSWDVIQRTVPLFTQQSVVCDTGNGHGSTNTRVRRWTNATSTGSDITYADSSTLGATFTINTPGRYAATYSDSSSAGTASFGVSLNSAQLTTNIGTITTANRLIMGQGAVNLIANCSVVFTAVAGDVVRCHTDNTPNAADARSQFRIERIG